MCWLSWFSGPGCCSGPGFHLCPGASDCSPGQAFCFMAPWAAAWICCLQLPYHTCKNGTHSTYFYSTGGLTPRGAFWGRQTIKNVLMPLFLMGCFPVDFQEAKRPLRTKSGKRPIKAGKRPINEGKRPIKGTVLVGVSVSCLMGCFRAPPPSRKTAPLKRPIKRSMNKGPCRICRIFVLDAALRSLCRGAQASR